MQVSLESSKGGVKKIANRPTYSNALEAPANDFFTEGSLASKSVTKRNYVFCDQCNSSISLKKMLISEDETRCIILASYESLYFKTPGSFIVLSFVTIFRARGAFAAIAGTFKSHVKIVTGELSAWRFER